MAALKKSLGDEKTRGKQGAGQEGRRRRRPRRARRRRKAAPASARSRERSDGPTRPARHRDLQREARLREDRRSRKGRKLKGKGDSFIVQKHDASRLHWDFRLELDGVLKSWAVTAGPSLDPGEKRLAVRTEDHPLDYGDFEGTIPEGEYGGGTVMLWDHGTLDPDPGKDPRKTIEEGHLHFTLEGERMKGEWVMFRLKPRRREGRDWMLKKVDDEYAEPTTATRWSTTALTSVTTGRTMAEIAAGEDVLALRTAAGSKGGRAQEARGAKAPPPFQRAAARDAGRRGADRQRLAARDTNMTATALLIARRRRRGDSLDPQRARLERQVPGARQSRRATCPPAA